MISNSMKVKLFNKMLELEHLAEAQTFDGRNYNEEANGAFQMLEILGIAKEYIHWAYNK